ncbi:MAG: FHA domain-containing protein [Pyrinomonadaceae bacterium]
MPPPVPHPHEPAKIRLPAAAGKGRRGPAKPAFIEVAGDDPVNVRRLELNKDVVRFGRAAELDLVFDVAASFISRIHAEVRRTPDGYVLNDLNSFNGTLLNGQRITGPRLLRDADAIQLGLRGPLLRFHQADGLHLAPPKPLPAAPDRRPDLSTTVTRVRLPSQAVPPPDVSSREPISVIPFDGKPSYVVGRVPESDVQLDGLQISKRHATLTVVGSQVSVEDNASTNGVYVNGRRLLARTTVGPRDLIQIGPFVLRADASRGIEVFDTRARLRVDSVGLTKVVSGGHGGEAIKLLDNISLTIQPNEFVGLLGPSGAGKSTFVDALNGMRPASAGQVLVNNLDLYQNLNWLKQSIGYVPQDDIIHRELTVYRTLYYVARLRLSEDVSVAEVDSIIAEVIDVTGLAERRHVPVAQLSGGQRKRVSVAVELLTKPSIIYLDEPTSGLDPATEEKIMMLFRQIADSGHTVMMTTHAMENVRLFDKIIVLMQGKLVFYGTPSEALAYVKAASFKELYDKLEEPVSQQLAGQPWPATGATPDEQQAHKRRLAQAREQAAEEWKRRFEQTPQYEQNVRQPQSGLPQIKPAPPPPKRRTALRNGLSQLATLSQRYAEVLRRDRFNLFILFGQAPVIAFLTYLAVGANSPRDFLYFILSLVPIWFGISVAAREIIRERAVYNRERMVNLGILPYVGSKLVVLTFIVSLQCLLLFGTLKLFSYFGTLKLPGLYGGLPQLLVMTLTAMVGISLGLLVSACVKTSEMATSLVPLLLIPQILFCGLTGVPDGVNKAVGALMPATWSFDEMKRLSNRQINVLRGKDEGAQAAFNNEGRGLYKQVRYESERAVENKEREIDKYKAEQEERIKRIHAEMEDQQRRHQRGRRTETDLDPPSGKIAVSFVPDDLSNYVDFLHPWGGPWLNASMLLLMFLGFTAATVGVLKAQDIS